MKTKQFLIALLFIGFLAITGCKKEGTSTFTLQIKAKYGSQNFALNSPNTDAQGRYIVMSTLRFYLSHINLIKSNGTLVNVAPVALFDFGDTMLTASVSNVQGTYTGISFACGLDSLTNDTTSPNLYLPPNPLSGSYDMYWPMIKYQFEVLEGKWDTVDIENLENALVYHIGTNAAYRSTTQLNQNFTVPVTGYNMVLYLDVAQIFNNTATNENISIVTEPSSMSSSNDNPVIMPAFADNFSHAFTFEGP